MKRSAFTLVEVLAAMAFMAILIPAILSAITLSNRVSITAERASIAMQLAENQLHQILIDGTWDTGNGRGDFGNDWRGYRWEMAKTDWSEDTMSQLTMTVYFMVQGREQKVRLTTLASDAQPQTPAASSTPSASP